MQHRNQIKSFSIELQLHEITDAQMAMIRDAQKEGFKDDYKALIAKRQQPANSSLVKINPRLGQAGAMRSGTTSLMMRNFR